MNHVTIIAEAGVNHNGSLDIAKELIDKAIPLLKEVGPENKEYSEARRLITLLRYFESMDGTEVPSNSLLKEFTGGSIILD